MIASEMSSRAHWKHGIFIFPECRRKEMKLYLISDMTAATKWRVYLTVTDNNNAGQWTMRMQEYYDEMNKAKNVDYLVLTYKWSADNIIIFVTEILKFLRV